MQSHTRLVLIVLVVSLLFSSALAGNKRSKFERRYDAFLGKTTEDVLLEFGVPEKAGRLNDELTYVGFHPKSALYARRTGFIVMLFKNDVCVRWDLRQNSIWDQDWVFVYQLN